jgi:hypothetical protein
MSLAKIDNQSYATGNECSMYKSIGASATTAQIGNVSTGSPGDYIESITVIPATSAATTFVLLDGTTAVFSLPTYAGGGTGTSVPQPVSIPLGIRATSRFNVTTGAGITGIVIGSWK